jgi:hypothetical protein
MADDDTWNQSTARVWHTAKSMTNTAEALFDEDGPTVGGVAKAAGSEIARSARTATVIAAGGGVMETVIRRGVEDGVARGLTETAARTAAKLPGQLAGAATGGLVAAGMEGVRLIRHPEERTTKGVTKAVAKATVGGVISVVGTPIAGILFGLVANYVIDRVVDENMSD